MPTVEKVEPSAFTDNLRRLWRGEQPLWEAFWIYLVVGSLVASTLGLLFAGVVQYVGLEEALGKSAALLLVYVPFSILAPALYQVFAAVGAWRSASWRLVTGILARIWIIFSVSITLFLIGGVLYRLSGSWTFRTICGGPKVWKLLRVRSEHSRLQGMIHGKRCGTSQNLGPAVRASCKRR
jgi:hypothetical protein